MTTDKIKNKLIDFNRQFKQNSGHFKSFEVIFDYINFLEAEPYLKKLIAPLFAYANKQVDLMFETAQNPEKSKAYDNIKLDILNPSNFSQEPIFNKEFIGWQKSLENKEEVNFMSMLPINLASLIMVAEIMQKIKDCQKEGDIERANELIKMVEEESFSVMPPANIKNFTPFFMLSNQFLDMSMELLNKHIIDKIDAQAFLKNQRPKPPFSFDKKNSILYIRGQEVKISRKGDLSTDHFILQAIFDRKDIYGEIDFKDIALDYIKMNEYDGAKDWQKFRHACDRLNDKVDKSTNGEVKDFIKYHLGKTGWCKINPDYL